MAESLSVERPIQLEPYTIDRKEWRRDAIRNGVRKSAPTMLFLITLLAVLEQLVTQNLTASIGMWIYFVALYGLYLWSSTRKAIANPLNRELWVTKQVEFDAEFFLTSTANGSSSRVPFKAFVKAEVHRENIYLYLSSSYFFPLPLRAFRTKEDEQIFRGLLLQYGLIKADQKK